MNARFVEDLQRRRIHLSQMIEAEAAINEKTVSIYKEERDKIEGLLLNSSTAIPYQCCPKCNGEGRISTLLSTSTYHTCDVCNGMKIIPMFVPKEVMQ